MSYVVQRKPFTLPLVFATDDNEIESSLTELNGLLAGVIVVVPDLDSTNTATVEVKDVDGNVIYTKTAIAKSTTGKFFIDANNFPLQLPLSGKHTVKITTSGAQTANRSFTVILLIKR
jgi:hypothetical protein